jgi:hypothetical protein
MSPVEFEPATLATDEPQAYALDHSATVVG